MTDKKRKFFTAGVLFLGLFLTLLILAKTMNVQAIGPEGSKVGLADLNRLVSTAFPFSRGWYVLTQILGWLSLLLAALFAAAGALELYDRKSLLKVDKEILVMGVLFAVTIILFVFFNKVAVNYRPVIVDAEEGLEASFPSSHTLLVVTVFGAAMFALRKLARNKKFLRISDAVCITVIVVMVLGRIFSGVHWITDIVAGLFLSLSLLNFYKAFIE